MTISRRENWLRAVEYRYPEWIPCSVGFAPLTWKTLGRDLVQLCLDHPRIFSDFDPQDVQYDEMPVVYRPGEHFRDNWGCVWFNMQGGLEGQVVEHPLADWRARTSTSRQTATCWKSWTIWSNAASPFTIRSSEPILWRGSPELTRASSALTSTLTARALPL